MYTERPSSILAVSQGEKLALFLRQTLPRDRFEVTHTASSAGEVMRLCMDIQFDIVIINTPLPDAFGVDLALEIADKTQSGVLLLVKEEQFDHTCDRVEDYGILTLVRPVGRQSLYQGLKLLVATHRRLFAIEKKAVTLENQMKEIRQINRAKWLLIEHLNMSEQDAHRYIEKSAMDKCVRRTEIAAEIIKTYGD